MSEGDIPTHIRIRQEDKPKDTCCDETDKYLFS